MSQASDEDYGFTGALSKSGLIIAATAAKLKIAAPNGAGVDFAIHGLSYHKADTDNIAMTAGAVQADLTTCLYLVQINAAGTVSTVKGTEELTANLVNGTRVLHYPRPAVDNCPLGALKIKTIAVTYTAATTDIDTSGLTDTYYDFCGGMPQKPLVL